MSRFEIGLNLIFGAIFILITSTNPLNYLLGVGVAQLVIAIFKGEFDGE